MLGVFAAMALLLALGGSYGVTSYLVSQRTRELGIRVALGARRGDISRAVLKGSLAVVAHRRGGRPRRRDRRRAVAVVAAVRRAAVRRASSSPSAAAALFSTGFLANWLPARRASRVDPMVSLRRTDRVIAVIHAAMSRTTSSSTWPGWMYSAGEDGPDPAMNK